MTISDELAHAFATEETTSQEVWAVLKAGDIPTTPSLGAQRPDLPFIKTKQGAFVCKRDSGTEFTASAKALREQYPKD